MMYVEIFRFNGDGNICSVLVELDRKCAPASHCLTVKL